MKHDLLSTVYNSIKCDWLERWKHQLGNPNSAPCQVLRAYVEELDITVACLDNAMEWDYWAGNDADDNDAPSNASA
jgi:hypothetical protein